MSGRQWHGAVSMMTREMWKKRHRARLLVFHFKRNVSAVPARQEEEYGDSVLASYRFLFCFLPPNNHEYRRKRNRSRLLPLPGFSHFPMESLLLLLPPFLKRDINFAFRSLSLSLSLRQLLSSVGEYRFPSAKRSRCLSTFVGYD